MSGILERLLSNKAPSTSKSYLIGLERGRIWAADYADYFEVKEWGEIEPEDFGSITLPHNEELHFKVLGSESDLELEPYIKGWLEGVKEIARK
ncbi:MAG: hypothetical protein PHF60_03175 [Candidatus ainarchaeum sp.]|nr:hypothetical protein [Candidatus ainarchaeum sp.]